MRPLSQALMIRAKRLWLHHRVFSSRCRVPATRDRLQLLSERPQSNYGHCSKGGPSRPRGKDGPQTVHLDGINLSSSEFSMQQNLICLVTISKFVNVYRFSWVVSFFPTCVVAISKWDRFFVCWVVFNYLWLSCLTLTRKFFPAVGFVPTTSSCMLPVYNWFWMLFGNELQIQSNLMKNLRNSWYFSGNSF